MELGADSVKDSTEVVGAVVDVDNSAEAVVVVVTGNDVDSSGSCVDERIGDPVDSRNLTGERGQDRDTGDRLLSSPGVHSASPGASEGSAAKKGYGLKKWRRIRREDRVTSVSPGLDSGKPLKRQISGINNPSSQLPQSREEVGDFVGLGPVNLLDNNLEGLSYFPAQGSSSTVFAMGAVSENSEDRSSKSSTAASAPRHGNGMNMGSPISGDKKKPKNPSGKVWSNSVQMGQLGKSRADPSKKLRGGERVKYEKEISQSSLESDSRSSNFVFMQTSNQRQSEDASVNYNEESDEDNPDEPHITDDQTAYSQANARQAEDISSRDLGADFSWEGNEENDGNHRSPTRQDVLVESIRTLDYAMVALEKEVQKFKEIGKDSFFTTADAEVSLHSSDYTNGEALVQNAHGSEEKITYLESKLEEASDALRIKELKVSGLEATLHSLSLHKEDTYNKTQEQEENTNLESELEILFSQKLEADVKYIATANALHDAKPSIAITKTLLAEQKALAEEQLEIRTRLEQTECRVGKVKMQAEELDTAVTGGNICKLACYSLTQLLMLLVALWAVYLKWASDSGVAVPT